MEATKVGTADIIRVLGSYNQKELEAKYGAEMAAVIMALSQSAWAANNSVNVGMTETAEVLNPMLAEPSTEQIYTTQPQWDFEEGESLQLGSTWTDTSVTPNKVYPIPSLVYDTDGNAHVVFPVWMWTRQRRSTASSQCLLPTVTTAIISAAAWTVSGGRR